MYIKEKIKYERKIYFPTNKKFIKDFLLGTDDFHIWKFQKSLRFTEYYNEKRKKCILYNILYYWYRRKKNKLGRKLGFDIPGGCFLEGLRIYHIGPIAVNPAAKIGRDCIIVGNVCIGNVEGLYVAPKIGDNCMLGWGSIVIGDITIANNCRIAAGAVVVKNVDQDNSVLVGVPASRIKNKH